MDRLLLRFVKNGCQHRHGLPDVPYLDPGDSLGELIMLFTYVAETALLQCFLQILHTEIFSLTYKDPTRHRCLGIKGKPLYFHFFLSVYTKSRHQTGCLHSPQIFLQTFHFLSCPS